MTLTADYIGPTGNGFTHVIFFGGHNYNYTETATDTISTTTDGLIAAINAGPDPYLYAVRANEFNRIILYSYVAGPAGENIIVNETSSNNTNTTVVQSVGAQLSITVYNPSTGGEAPARSSRHG